MSPRHIMITGAAGGVGRAIVAAFAESRTSLVLADDNAAALDLIATKVPPELCRTVRLDVASDNDWQRAAKTTELRLDELDGLILAAGIEGPIGYIEDVPEAEFDRVMNVNVKGVWLALRTIVPRMKMRRCGVVVIIVSLSGRMGSPMLALYSASKHAAIGLVRSAARELAPYGIRVNAVAPGPIEGEMMNRIDENLLKLDPHRFNGRKDARQSIPIGRYIKPEEVAKLACFLSSEESSGCTGGVFAVDGGFGTW